METCLSLITPLCYQLHLPLSSHVNCLSLSALLLQISLPCRACNHSVCHLAWLVGALE